MQEAGQAVKSAAENLVKAAQNSVEAAMDEEVAVKVSDRQVSLYGGCACVVRGGGGGVREGYL